MEEIRIYYECLEQAEYFVTLIPNKPQGVHVHLIRRQKDHKRYSKKLAPIIYWKDPDLLLSVVKNNIEYPLLQIEFSTAEFTADHELQRFDGLDAAAQNNC